MEHSFDFRFVPEKNIRFALRFRLLGGAGEDVARLHCAAICAAEIARNSCQSRGNAGDGSKPKF